MVHLAAHGRVHDTQHVVRVRNLQLQSLDSFQLHLQHALAGVQVHARQGVHVRAPLGQQLLLDGVKHVLRRILHVLRQIDRHAQQLRAQSLQPRDRTVPLQVRAAKHVLVVEGPKQARVPYLPSEPLALQVRNLRLRELVPQQRTAEDLRLRQVSEQRAQRVDRHVAVRRNQTHAIAKPYPIQRYRAHARTALETGVRAPGSRDFTLHPIRVRPQHAVLLPPSPQAIARLLQPPSVPRVRITHDGLMQH